LSRDPRGDAVSDALREADAGSGGEAECEVLLRRSRGSSVRRARGSGDESTTWEEEGASVRVLLPGGGQAVATVGLWAEAGEAAREALRLAAAATGGADAGGGLVAARERALPAQPIEAEPPSPHELAHRLSLLEREALAQDERVVALDVALVRSAVVDSYLVSTAGTAQHQRVATSQAHAAVAARDGMQVAVRGDAWAGARFDDAAAIAFGRRVGRAALVHLVGSGAAPPAPRRVLLGPAALAEITHGLASALLGLRAGVAGATGLPARLRLEEDAGADVEARALPIDGAGRLLRRVAIIEGGAWRPPGSSGVPRVRAGLGDPPRAGFMRLSWSWRDGVTEDELVARMGTGLLAESAHAIRVDPETLSWRGVVAGAWVEDGRRRHALSGMRFSASLLDLLRGAIDGGAEPLGGHPSGAIRAIPLLVEMGPGPISENA
jgi:predicted Zn-dependent protease